MFELRGCTFAPPASPPRPPAMPPAGAEPHIRPPTPPPAYAPPASSSPSCTHQPPLESSRMPLRMPAALQFSPSALPLLPALARAPSAPPLALRLSPLHRPCRALAPPPMASPRLWLSPPWLGPPCLAYHWRPRWRSRHHRRNNFPCRLVLGYLCQHLRQLSLEFRRRLCYGLRPRPPLPCCVLAGVDAPPASLARPLPSPAPSPPTHMRLPQPPHPPAQALPRASCSQSAHSPQSPSPLPLPGRHVGVAVEAWEPPHPLIRLATSGFGIQLPEPCHTNGAARAICRVDHVSRSGSCIIQFAS